MLQGDCSGLGGLSGYEDLELMRKEAETERAWGRMPAGVSIAGGEVDGTEGRRVEETQHESTGDWKYDNWESSCLAKFSEFLGFQTKGFEKEILELLRSLVASLKKDKEKGNMIVTRSERELRRLKSTVTPQISGVIFFFFFSYKSSMYFSYTYPKYIKLYCSNIFLQNANQGHNSTFFLLTASRERRLLVYLKGGSHDGVSKAQ